MATKIVGSSKLDGETAQAMRRAHEEDATVRSDDVLVLAIPACYCGFDARSTRVDLRG